MKVADGKGRWWKLKRAMGLDDLPPATRRIITAVVGGVILLAGLVMLILPGPAVLVIPLGLAILATEFPWAQRWLSVAHAKFRTAREKVRTWKRRRRG